MPMKLIIIAVVVLVFLNGCSLAVKDVNPQQVTLQTLDEQQNQTAAQLNQNQITLQHQNALRRHIEAWSAGYPAEIKAARLKHPEKLALFYERRQFKALWHESGEITVAGQTLISRIASIGKEGLLPIDYHGDVLNRLDELTLDQQELLLSDAFLTLSSHLKFGKVNPETLTADWKQKKKQVDTSLLLDKIQESDSIESLLNSIRPVSARYSRLINAYERLLPHADLFTDALALSPAIKKGQIDSRIPEIRRRLIFWGDLQPDAVSDAGATKPSAKYDESLFDAMQKFQARHGLDKDGVIGKETLLALNMSVSQRLQDLAVNMERWRWLEDMGQRFAVVNIANFDLRIYQDNEVVFQKPVIVGRNYRKTPVFSDRIRYLVLNPTWTVPQKLAVEDKLPEIKKDPDYLNRLGFTLYQSGTSNIIDPATVDWTNYTKQFPFRMVQSPGPMNALGQVKFMFPNQYDVYLHDTPSRELFSQTQRAFSSGCIRVSDPIELAEFLLKDQGWTRERLDTVLASRVTETVHLKMPMPIHLEYWTSWVDRDGTLNFRNDIYARNADLWKALQKPMK